MSVYENGFLMGSLFFSAGSILTVSLGYYAFLHRIKLLENCNHHYITFNKYLSNLNPITVMETIKLKSNTVYHIKLLDKYFIVKDLNIDIDQYKKLKISLVIPHSPEDILEATLISDDEEIDITDLSKLLIGPLLNQITDQNEKWIFEYLDQKLNYTNINTFEITLINGKKNSLKNRNI